MERRSFLRAVTAGTGAVAVTGGLWHAAATPAAAAAADSPYGPLLAPDANGLALPQGFTGRVVARSTRSVGGITWHGAPDGGACFADGDGWIYVSNSELEDDRGGVGALRFDRDGAVSDAYRILDGTNKNCSGGATPWGTWLSCEEAARGAVWETHPRGGKSAVRHPAMGLFRHEAAAVDTERRCVYLTEDHSNGCFYRYIPTRWPDLSDGRLEVLCGGWGTSVPVTWAEVPDPEAPDSPTRHQVRGAKRFKGGEGCVYSAAAGSAWFTTKGDSRVWRLDVEADRVDLAYDYKLLRGASLRGVDNMTIDPAGDLLVAEDAGNMEICLVRPGGAVSTFLRVLDHRDSEITGPAFSPDRRRLYFSSQRGRSGKDSGGITYEITGPFRSAGRDRLAPT
jgi:hypothetical protein